MKGASWIDELFNCFSIDAVEKKIEEAEVIVENFAKLGFFTKEEIVILEEARLAYLLNASWHAGFQDATVEQIEIENWYKNNTEKEI